MSNSEFKWNKRRKHYAYSHKKRGTKEENLLISSKPYVLKRKNNKNKIILVNVPLYHHPNPNKEGQFYVIPRNYLDESTDFDSKIYSWNWNHNDKRKIKRIKKLNKHK